MLSESEIDDYWEIKKDFANNVTRLGGRKGDFEK